MAIQKRFIAKNGLDNNSQTIQNVATPVNSTDVANKAYVDANAGGGGGGTAAIYTKQLNFVGSVSVGAGTLRWYPDTDIVITSIFSTAGIAPSGDSLVMNVKKSGTTIASTTLTFGQNRSPSVAVNATVLTTEYITVDVVSSNASADATLTFSYTRV